MLYQENKLKILITTDLYTVSTNGVVTSVQNLFDELTANGHDVRILTISGDLHSHKEGAVYYIRSVPLKGVYPDLRMPTSFRHKLIQEIIDWKPDVVHSQCEFFSYQFAARISRITGAPIVHTYHTLYEQYMTSYLIPSKRLGDYLVKMLSRRRLKRVSTLVAPTQKVENTLHGYGMDAPISVVPSGISLQQHFQRLPEAERRARRQELGISEDDLVLINLGRLGGEKNLGELLEFFAEARKKNDGLKFLIVGDGTEYGALQAFIEAEQPQNVALWKRLPKEDYDKLVSACDIGMIFLEQLFTQPIYGLQSSTIISRINKAFNKLFVIKIPPRPYFLLKTFLPLC